MVHYEANGWMVGRVPMKCWKSTVVKWKKDRKKRQGRRDSSRPIQTTGGSTTVDEYYEELGFDRPETKERGEG